MTLALFLMFDKWEEIGSDIKTEGYQCVRDYKVRKWTQRDPNWAIKWELLSFRQATWSDFSSSGPLSISEKKKTKKVLQPVTCNEDVCTLYTLQIIQTAAKVTKMPWYMMYIGELHFTDWAWQISDTSSTNLASGPLCAAIHLFTIQGCCNCSFDASSSCLSSWSCHPTDSYRHNSKCVTWPHLFTTITSYNYTCKLHPTVIINRCRTECFHVEA